MQTESARLSDGLARWMDHPLTYVGAAGLLVMMFATVLSTLGNTLFSRPIPDIVTIDEVLMAFLVFLPLAGVQLRRDHIEVGIATDWLPARHIASLRIFGCAVSLLAFGLLFTGLALGAWEAWVDNDLYSGEYEFPSWPARAIAALGALGFLVRLAVDAVQTFRLRRSAPQAAAGPTDKP